jgi:hypothetical protein
MVEMEGILAGVVVLAGFASALGKPVSTSFTTSSWARTDAGRSVTSAATTDVAVQTTAVDPTVATSHSPMANNRVRGTSARMPSSHLPEG